MSVARISRPKLLDAPLRPAQQPVDYGDGYNEFEVDTAAPTVVSGTPTGRRVSRYANVMVTFDDNTYGSKKFVNVYKRGSNTPLPVSYRDEYSKR